MYSYEQEFIQSLLRSVGRLGTRYPFNHTSLMADRNKFAHNRCVIQVLVTFLCCQLVFEFSVGIEAFVIGLSQISFFFFFLRGVDCKLHSSMYDKRDDFNFHITNFPFLSGDIPCLPVCCIFVTRLTGCVPACYSYACVILRTKRTSS